MLRQVYIFNKGQQKFMHSFAMALGPEELTHVLDSIKSYIDMPMPGKTFKRPMSSFQIFHRGIGTTYFLFVTDLVDSIDYVEDVIKKIMNKFQELFPNPEDIANISPQKNVFVDFLNQMQQSLHSKITILGPIGSGKTTLYEMLRTESTERQIMNFAKSSLFKMDNLSFDLWDFQLKDNFSLLWSKFVGGSDLVILLIDVSNCHLTVIDHFLKLQRVEGKFSRLLALLNKTDLASLDDIKRIKTEINIPNLREISLNDPQAKQKAITYIREVFQLKKPLPPNFMQMIQETEIIEKDKKFTLAISKFKELINICNQFQEFTYIDTFKEKVKELEKKQQEEKELQKESERKKKFSAPKQISFTSKVGVKGLPTAKPLPTAAPKGKPVEKSVEAQKSPILYNPEMKSDQESETYPTKIGTTPKSLSDKNILNNEFNFAEELKRIIEGMGGSLSIVLCEHYIKELMDVLQRPLNLQDLQIAAKSFIQKERQE